MSPARPLWLTTLADLALLLLGFLLLIHATRTRDGGDEQALAASIRSAFGGEVEAAPPVEIALDVNGMAGFAPGADALPADPAALVDWAAEAAADPRSRLVITGAADPSEGLALAARRAAALAERIERDGRVPAGRLRLNAQLAPDARRVALSVSYGQ